MKKYNIDDIYELKDLLGNNFDKCLEEIDKDSDISKYFSEEYLKNYLEDRYNNRLEGMDSNE